jgi:hypothetical protein
VRVVRFYVSCLVLLLLVLLLLLFFFKFIISGSFQMAS